MRFSEESVGFRLVRVGCATMSQSDAEPGDVESGELPDSISAKQVILNAYLIARPGVKKQDVSDAINELIDVSYEFVRRTINDVEEGEISKEDVSALADAEIQDALRPAMRERGLLTPQTAAEDADVVTWPAAVGQSGGSIPVSEVQRVLRDLELLRKQADFESGDQPNTKVEFIASHVHQELSELIETYSTSSGGGE